MTETVCRIRIRVVRCPVCTPSVDQTRSLVRHRNQRGLCHRNGRQTRRRLPRRSIDGFRGGVSKAPPTRRRSKARVHRQRRMESDRRVRAAARQGIGPAAGVKLVDTAAVIQINSRAASSGEADPSTSLLGPAEKVIDASQTNGIRFTCIGVATGTRSARPGKRHRSSKNHVSELCWPFSLCESPASDQPSQRNSQ